jgi:hypothetical protein
MPIVLAWPDTGARLLAPSPLALIELDGSEARSAALRAGAV